MEVASRPPQSRLLNDVNKTRGVIETLSGNPTRVFMPACAYVQTSQLELEHLPLLLGAAVQKLLGPRGIQEDVELHA